MNWKNAILKYPGLEQLSKWKIRWKDLVNKETKSFEPKVLHDALSEWVDGVKFPKKGNEILKLKKKVLTLQGVLRLKNPPGIMKLHFKFFCRK
jgi:hypothetical protein